MLFSVVPWLIMMVVMMPMAGAGFFGLDLGMAAPVMTLMLHLVFGAVLGSIYGVRASGVTPAWSTRGSRVVASQRSTIGAAARLCGGPINLLDRGSAMTDDVSCRGLGLAKAAIAIAGLLFVTAGWWLRERFPQWFAIDTVRRAVEVIWSLGARGVLRSIALMIAHSFLPFPAEVVAIANGLISGPL